jgi:Fe-S-cluster-containing dehydrogenase component
MTTLPPPSPRKLGLVIDLDICVGCHACAVACKSWNEQGQFGPLPDENAYAADPLGVWFNRVHTYEVDSGNPLPPVVRGDSGPARHAAPAAATKAPMTVHFPRSCLHCETPDCVTVCPTGASYKRAEDGIVLVDEDKCIGCKLCAWACPYGAREYSEVRGVMQKCTLCVDRIYNQSLAPADRQPACVLACPTRARHFGDLGDADSSVARMVEARAGFAPEPLPGYGPVNRYLPPRPRRDGPDAVLDADDDGFDARRLSPLLRWVDRLLSR